LLSYALFHTLIEFATIIVGCAIFILAWHTRRFYEDNYLLLLGIAYLFVSIVDFVHTLAYKGVGIFPRYDADIAISLWIVARYMQSLTLLAAPFFIRRKLNPAAALLFYTVVTLLLLSSVFLKIFPTTYNEETGLTLFKVISEYVICAVLLVSTGLLLDNRRAFDPGVLRLLVASNLLLVGGELAFTAYVSVYDLANLIGHFFKLLAFVLVYYAIIRTGLEKPYNLLFFHLKQSETALQEANDLLEAKVIERTAELDEANAHLRAELAEREQKEMQISRQLRRIACLHAIDQAITHSLDFSRLAEVVLENVETGLGNQASMLLLLNRKTSQLEFAAARGFRAARSELAGIVLDQSPPMRAALTQSIVYIPDLMVAGEPITREALFQNENFCAYHAAPLIVDGRSIGVLEVFQRSSFKPDPEWLDFLVTLAGQAAIAVDKVRLLSDLRSSNAELVQAYDETINGWSRALDLRDRETEGHSQRVASMTVHLAHLMGVSDSEIVHIRRGALLHDIGKMGIPDGILQKPDKLSDEEWAVMRKHPSYAYEMLSPVKYLLPALDIPYGHHEKWDGSGYPRGLKGELIPLAARVFAVVDVWDALRSDRPYRKALDDAQVYAYIQAQAGSHFDPRVVDCFLSWALKQDSK